MASFHNLGTSVTSLSFALPLCAESSGQIIIVCMASVSSHHTVRIAFLVSVVFDHRAGYRTNGMDTTGLSTDLLSKRIFGTSQNKASAHAQAHGMGTSRDEIYIPFSVDGCMIGWFLAFSQQRWHEVTVQCT